jgi:hypothetical protein
MKEAEQQHNTPDGEAPEAPAPVDEAVVAKKEASGPDYAFALPEDVVRLITPFDGGLSVGTDLDQVTYEDDKRAAYNQLSREMKKTRARDINFDQCGTYNVST